MSTDPTPDPVPGAVPGAVPGDLPGTVPQPALGSGAALQADDADESETDEDIGWGDDVAARVLNQAEIDNLLGFGDEPASEEPPDGMRRVVTAGLMSYERLPMLEIVFDRLVRILSVSLRSMTSDNVEVSIDKITSMRFGDYMNSIPLPAILSVFKAEQWDNYGLMVVDAPMIYSIVDTLLGGRRSASSARIEGRPYTTIERTLVERMAGQILRDLSVSFDPVCKVAFSYERTEVNPRFAAISRTSTAAILIKLRLEMDQHGGCFDIVLPYATLEPIRDLLLQQFMGERFGQDQIWESHLAEELRDTEVELDAVLGEQSMNLSQLLDLKVGSQIVFALTPDDPVELRCGGVPLFRARTGNRRDRVAVQIEGTLKSPGTLPGLGSPSSVRPDLGAH